MRDITIINKDGERRVVDLDLVPPQLLDMKNIEFEMLEDAGERYAVVKYTFLGGNEFIGVSGKLSDLKAIMQELQDQYSMTINKEFN